MGIADGEADGGDGSLEWMDVSVGVSRCVHERLMDMYLGEISATARDRWRVRYGLQLMNEYSADERRDSKVKNSESATNAGTVKSKTRNIRGNVMGDGRNSGSTRRG